MNHSIDHCQLRAQMLENMNDFDFREAVMQRVQEIVSNVQTGQPTTAHEFAGVEIVAQSVARHVLEEGARILASDMNSDIARLKEQTVADHISSC